MRKTFIKTIALFAVICLLFPCFTMAYAETAELTGRNSNSRIIPGDIELDNPVIWEDGDAYNLVEVFTIVAEKVTYSLRSSEGSKSFRLSDLPSSVTQLVLVANLKHSYQLLEDDETDPIFVDNYIKFGVCYWGILAGRDEYEYISVYGYFMDTSETGKDLYVAFDIDDYLESRVTYYSFVTNHHGFGNPKDDDYVFGTLGLFYPAP